MNSTNRRNAPKQMKNHAKRRLFKDWKELEEQKESLPTIAALPTSDIFIWHANLRPDSGPYKGTVFHLILRFPASYPTDPPDIKLCSYMNHPNVFTWSNSEYYICLDMIQKYYTSQPYVGWTSAYGLVSILLQLSSFLLAKNIPQKYGGTIRNVLSNRGASEGIKAARKFVYDNITTHDGQKAQHTHDNPWPPLPKLTQKQKTTLSVVKPSSSPFYPDKLPTDFYTHIFSFLGPEDLLRSQNVCSHWGTIIKTYNLFERSQICCFHTKATMDNPQTTILGIGLKVVYHRDGRTLKSITSPLDILSLVAFDQQNVRTGVWGGETERFDYFLPLVLNESHGEKAVKKMESTIFAIMKHCEVPTMNDDLPRRGKNKNSIRSRYAPKEPINNEKFHPLMAFELLATLMNSMVVELMDAAEKKAGAVSRHASEKALEGYCAFHHMLLFFAERYPITAQYADQQIKRFLSSPYLRHKAQAPNLGILIICLTLSRANWDTLKKPLVREAFDRNVRWILQKYPVLAKHNISHTDRLSWTFEGAKTSLRLLMFQTYFMNHVGRPARSPWTRVLQRYNQQLGKPTTELKADIQNNAKEILAVTTWPAFFTKIGGPVPSSSRLVEILEESVINSGRRRYHDVDRQKKIEQAEAERKRVQQERRRQARELRERLDREEEEREARRAEMLVNFWETREQRARDRAEEERLQQARLQEERGLEDYFA